VSLVRRNPKRDSNEKAVRAALHDCGVRTWTLSAPGLPDLLCALRKRFFLVEVKRPNSANGKGEWAQLTPHQRKFHEDARLSGWPVYVARNEQDVLDIVNDFDKGRYQG